MSLLKAELEILSLHEKLDELREMKWSELITALHKKSSDVAAAASPTDVRQGYALPVTFFFNGPGYARGSGSAQSFWAKGRTGGIAHSTRPFHGKA